MEKLSELLIQSISCKHKTAAVECILNQLLEKFSNLINFELNYRLQICESQNVNISDLLLACYELHCKSSKGYNSTSLGQEFNKQLEALMIRLYQPNMLNEGSLDFNSFLDLSFNTFLQVTFQTVKDYCTKRWNEEYFRNKSIAKENLIKTNKQQQQLQQIVTATATGEEGSGGVQSPGSNSPSKSSLTKRQRAAFLKSNNTNSDYLNEEIEIENENENSSNRNRKEIAFLTHEELENRVKKAKTYEENGDIDLIG